MDEDQNDRRSDKFFTDPSNPDMTLVDKLTKRDNDRADKMMNLIENINEPSAKSIGLDGSRAVWLISLHNISAELQKKILDKMTRIYDRDKSQVFYPGIPYLEDRVRISTAKSLESAKQLYGTQAYYDRSAGKLRPFPITNPKNLAQRRRKFDLTPNPTDKCTHSHDQQ